MIRTSRQLKALVRNLSRGDSAMAQIIIRNYVMERFLERLSISSYRDNLILKGGILVAAMDTILNETENSPEMASLWKNYQRKFEYASDIGWSEVMQAVKKMCGDIK